MSQFFCFVAKKKESLRQVFQRKVKGIDISFFLNEFANGPKSLKEHGIALGNR
jgi:hypothetical protein